MAFIRSKAPKFPSFQGANASGLNLQRVVPLCVTIGDLSKFIWFRVVKRLANKILLGTSYLIRLVQRIEPLTRRLTPARSKKVPLLAQLKDRDPFVTYNERSRLSNTAAREKLLDQDGTSGAYLFPHTAVGTGYLPTLQPYHRRPSSAHVGTSNRCSR